MAMHPSQIIKQVVLKLGYTENPNGTITHPYEEELKNSKIALVRRRLRLENRWSL